MRRVLVLLAVWAGVASAEPRALRGVIFQKGTRSPVVGASVLSDKGAVAASDIDGFFAITVEATDKELTIAATGYQPRSVPIHDGLIVVELSVTSGAEVIEVSGKAPEQTKPLSYQLSVDEIREIPGAGNDILRAATVLPGVARIPYSFGGLVLRGMSPRDTEVYLDGIAVPIAFHFGGITSFYPSGMLADLAITAGGFDASYGRAEGGLVELATREPRTDHWRMGGSIGLFDSSVQAEGPWQNGGVLIGVRRSYFDRIADPFVAEDVPLPSYWDFQVRTTFGDSRGGGRYAPMVFGSIDRVASNEMSLTSMFVRAAVPYLVQRGKLSLHVVPWVGTNRLTLEDSSDEELTQTFARPVYLGGVRGEALRDTRWGHLRGGLELSSGYLAQTEVNVDPADGPSERSNGTSTVGWSDAAAWGELRWKLDGERFALKPGVRAEVYGLTGELVVDPRLNIHQRLSDTLTLRQSIGRFHQPPTPGDVDRLDGNPNLDSSYVDQLSLGLDADLPEQIKASLTGFYDYGQNIGVEVRNPRPGSDMPEPNFGGLGPTFQLLLEKQLGFAIYRENLGRARSKGLELSLKRNVGRLFTLVSYTFAKAERTDDPRFAMGWRPFELDQRHNLQLAASLAFTKWRLGGRLQLVTGNPYSPTHSEGDILVQEPWAGRLPVFASLDVRADRRWRQCWGDIALYIDVQNATNRHNVEGRELGYDEATNSDKDQDIPGLPIIPFIGVEFLPTK